MRSINNIGAGIATLAAPSSCAYCSGMAIDSAHQIFVQELPSAQLSALVACILATIGALLSLWYLAGGLALLVAQFAPARVAETIRSKVLQYGPPLLRKAAGISISASTAIGFFSAPAALATTASPATEGSPVVATSPVDLGPGAPSLDLTAGALPQNLSYYTVQPGDSLWSISQERATSVNALYDRNKTVIGPNPNLIQPGQNLAIPKEDK